MMLDAELEFSSGEAVAATGASENYLDLGAAINLGAGEVPKVLVHVDAVSGTNPTLKVEIEVDDNTSFSSATVVGLIDTLSPPVADTIYRVALKSYAKERYMRLKYTIGGTDTPTVTVTAALILDEQTTPMVNGT